MIFFLPFSPRIPFASPSPFYQSIGRLIILLFCTFPSAGYIALLYNPEGKISQELVATPLITFPRHLIQCAGGLSVLPLAQIRCASLFCHRIANAIKRPPIDATSLHCKNIELCCNVCQTMSLFADQRHFTSVCCQRGVTVTGREWQAAQS